MPLAAGFVGILPALGLLDEKRDGVPPVHLSWIAAVGWSCAVAFFGYVARLALFLVKHLFERVLVQCVLVTTTTEASGMLPPSLYYRAYTHLLYRYVDHRGAACIPIRDGHRPTHFSPPSTTSTRHFPKAASRVQRSGEC